MVKKKANITPKKTLFPTVLRGSTGVKFKDRNPIAVVIEVKNKGCKFSLRLSVIESLEFNSFNRFWK
jgi:hypothetical protein